MRVEYLTDVEPDKRYVHGHKSAMPFRFVCTATHGWRRGYCDIFRDDWLYTRIVYNDGTPGFIRLLSHRTGLILDAKIYEYDDKEKNKRIADIQAQIALKDHELRILNAKLKALV